MDADNICGNLSAWVLLLSWKMFTERARCPLQGHFIVVSEPSAATSIPLPFLHGNTDRQTGSSCCQGNSHKVCSATLWQNVSEVRKERNVEGKALPCWWNLIRLWQRIKRDISSFQLVLIEWESVCFVCVCSRVHVFICSHLRKHCRLPASKPGNRLTDAQNDRQALESWQPCYFSLPPPPPLLAHPHTSFSSLMPLSPLCHLSSTSDLSLGIKWLHMDCHIIRFCHWE